MNLQSVISNPEWVSAPEEGSWNDVLEEASSRPTETTVKNQNVTAKLPPVFRHLAGRDLTRENMECFNQQYRL